MDHQSNPIDESGGEVRLMPAVLGWNHQSLAASALLLRWKQVRVGYGAAELNRGGC
uniref:Uncharacterized protein n=1 Tax=Arundo donax TaxID=35708 RepID=A0A0A9GI69_ARUDO